MSKSSKKVDKKATTDTYYVVQGLRVIDVVSVMNTMVKDGWRPVGGISLINGGMRLGEPDMFIQAAFLEGDINDRDS